MLSEHDQQIVADAVEGFLQWGRAKDRGDKAEMERIIDEFSASVLEADDYEATIAAIAAQKHNPNLRDRRIADIEAAGEKRVN